MDALGRHQRQAVGEVEAHLVPEHRERTGPGAVLLALAVLAHVAQQLEVLAHQARFPDTARARYAQASMASPATTIGSDNSWPMVTQPNPR